MGFNSACKGLSISSNTPFCLQESCIQHITATQVFADHIGQELNMRLMNLAVSFMNTADVMAVVTVLVNFQIQIVLDL